MSFKPPTSKQFVAALIGTTERYMHGFISYSTLGRHNRALWSRVKQSPAMTRRVVTLLRQREAQHARQSFLVIKGGAR